ncbi:MAG: tRNA uridine-5-carboxymethylaminomethyl(34) synthesis GTPase MnmE [Leptolyngbya sp. IPPAS B-1204]|nr:tRNA uridine-5-carboxymethylaminomethyl(34) synthesis GTPase MnmE [Elainella sp. C42_A2020_010]RNJ65434.1 MAG: tRNA uridine-5-carboxymethylaminomethyl(34) synthesis GTPase MnmE [Leptolyngbya sp. IPPAS B-1204]
MTAQPLSQDTIVAIATAIVPQQGSVGIVRLSGPESVMIARTLFHAPGRQAWDSHRILYGYVRHPQTEQLIDEALLLLMLAPRSYTREDVVEFHCHGGIMAVQQVLTLCLEQGARLAQPGEFTLRAFLNGRLDLTQAESIADLVGAESPQAAQTALAGLEGKLAHPIRQLRATCLDILAEVEARIDFEDDLPPLDEEAIKQQLRQALAEVEQILATADRGELLRTGLKVAIVGRPNVGKSSLLNAWSRSDRAIVTELPGTTRDVVESRLVVAGIPVQVLDTAGIREATDRVEQIGVERSRTAAQSADLVLLTIDAQTGWTDADAMIYEQVKQRPLILVLNKIDLVASPPPLPDLPPTPTVKTAAAHQQGIDALEQAILSRVQAGALQAANLDLAINQRQAAALTRAKTALQQVQATIADQLPLDFWTIDLRSAIQALGEITGEEITESVLDQIFSRFCIGK